MVVVVCIYMNYFLESSGRIHDFFLVLAPHPVCLGWLQLHHDSVHIRGMEDRWMDEWVGGWMDEWRTDGRMDGQMVVWSNAHKPYYPMYSHE